MGPTEQNPQNKGEQLIPLWWSDEMKRFVLREYPMRGRTKCTALFNRFFGTSYNKSVIQRVARGLGVTEAESHASAYSVSELARMIGVTPEALRNQIERGTLRAYRAGRRYLIPEEEANRVLERYLPVKPPWPAMTVKEAAEYLGFRNKSSNTVADAARRGYIDSINIQGKVYVRRSHIEEAERFMAQTGFVFVRWRQLHEKRSKHENNP